MFTLYAKSKHVVLKIFHVGLPRSDVTSGHALQLARAAPTADVQSLEFGKVCFPSAILHTCIPRADSFSVTRQFPAICASARAAHASVAIRTSARAAHATIAIRASARAAHAFVAICVTTCATHAFASIVASARAAHAIISCAESFFSPPFFPFSRPRREGTSEGWLRNHHVEAKG